MDIYLIKWDNQESYEDYYEVNLCACQTEERAKELIKELEDWYLKTKNELPPYPVDELVTQEAYEKQFDERREAIKKLVAPYGLDQINDFDSYRDHSTVSLRYNKVSIL